MKKLILILFLNFFIFAETGFINDTLVINDGQAINEISTDDTLSGNSDTALPTEQAVKTYVDNNAGGGAGGNEAYKDADGLTVKLNSSNSNYQLDVDADRLFVNGNNLTSINLTIDITSSGANGLEASDSEGASKWYEVYVIYNSSTTTIAGLLNEYSTAIGTTPSGYDDTRLVGYVRNDGSSDFSIVDNIELTYQTDISSISSYSSSDLTLDGTFNDLDISEFVPPSAYAIAIVLAIKDDAVNSIANIRGKTNTTSLSLRTQVANIRLDVGTVLEISNGNRTINYYGTNTTWTLYSIYILGWFHNTD